MANQQENRLIPESYTKNSISHLIAFQFDNPSKEEIIKIISKYEDNSEASKGFIQSLQSLVGGYIEVRRQEKIYESDKQVDTKINQDLKKITSLIQSLDEIAQSDEMLNRLNIILPTYKSIEERTQAINNSGSQPLPNLVNDTLSNQKKNLEDFSNLLSEAKKLTLKGKGGRPKKDLRIIYIRKFAITYALHISKPTATRDGPFESIVKICLDSSGDFFEDIHSSIVDALKLYKPS